MTRKKENVIIAMKASREDQLMASLECFFAAIDKRVAAARNEAEKNVSPEVQAHYAKYHRSEIEYGIEFPVKGMLEILKSDPEYAILCNNVGICYYEAEEYRKAEKWFINAIEAIPENYSYNEPYLYLEKIRKRRDTFHIL